MAADLVCYITGGASGLGKATALRLGKNGAKIIIADLPGSNGAAVVEEIGSEAALFHPTDVTNASDIQAGIRLAVERFGKINVLVNCAGFALPHRTLDDDGKAHPLDRFERVINVNLIGTFNAIRLVAEEMAKNKIDSDTKRSERGVIINTSSIAGIDGSFAAYSASKAGVIGMTLPIARDLAMYGIRVNTIAPGLFLTPAVGDPAVVEPLLKEIPFPSRAGDPDEFAQLVESIIENPMINGETIRIDGAARIYNSFKRSAEAKTKAPVSNFLKHLQ